jgi:hypothetical protein
MKTPNRISKFSTFKLLLRNTFSHHDRRDKGPSRTNAVFQKRYYFLRSYHFRVSSRAVKRPAVSFVSSVSHPPFMRFSSPTDQVDRVLETLPHPLVSRRLRVPIDTAQLGASW